MDLIGSTPYHWQPRVSKFRDIRKAGHSKILLQNIAYRVAYSARKFV